MTRILTALFLVLLMATMVEAAPPVQSIDNLTLGDLRGPKVPKEFHDGVMTGVFLTVSSSGALRCQLMSARMVIAAVDAALQTREVSLHWRVYNAVLYVLVRAGCVADTDPQPESETPQEKPNA